MKSIRWFVVIGLLACMCGPVSAYDPENHEQLSRLAGLQSNLKLDSSLLSDLGLYPYDVRQLKVETVPEFRSIEDLLTSGARLEDEETLTVNVGYFGGGIPQIRVLNHFFDPQNGGRGLTATINGSEPVSLGYPSPDWALEDQGTVFGYVQNYSYRDGQVRLYQALTASTKEERFLKFGDVFRTLGQVMHLIQDAAQPQHTRNAPHLPFREHILVPQYLSDAPWYERHTLATFPDDNSMEQFIAGNPYNLSPALIDQRLSTARDYFYSAGATVPKYSGMAEYSALNFTSFNNHWWVRTDTGAVEAYSPEFPLPNGVNVNGTLRRTETKVFTYKGKVLQLDILVGNVYDELTGLTFLNRELGFRSMVSKKTGRGAGRIMYTPQNELIADLNYELLLPRATAFSAGMINHFFRARMDLMRDPAVSSGRGWIIRNLGPAGQTLSGTFSIYREDGSQVRTLLFPSGATWDRTIDPGMSVAVTLPSDIPAGTSKLVLVFWGRVGASEPSPLDTGFATAAGKVVDYSPPPPVRPCEGPLAKAGYAEGYVTNHSSRPLMELGLTAGPVQVEFEAYDIPDRLKIRRNSSNGTVLVDTNGFVSGFHTFTIDHNPGPNDTTKLYIDLTGNQSQNPGTYWTLNIGCPGQELNNSVRAQPRVNITFWYTGGGGSMQPACASGYYSYYLDGQLVGKIGYNGGSPSLAQITKTTTAGPGHYVTITSTVTRYPSGFGCNYSPLTHHWKSTNAPTDHSDHVLAPTGGVIDVL